MTTDLTMLRENYHRAALDESNITNDPVQLFGEWLQHAISLHLPEPYALTLATASQAGEPSARTVLLRGYGDDGFVFYTNYASEKGRQLANNPRAQMLFFWHQLEQQVRVSGHVEKMAESVSTAYFHKRPHDSQLGAWVSQPQSGVVASRAEMESAFAALAERYPEGSVVPKPPEWGGYRLIPTQFEFWQGRPNRMHDRLQYVLIEGSWQLSRLYP